SKRKASFNRFLLAHFDDSVRDGEVGERWSDAGANAGDVSFGRRAPEGDRAYRFDGDNFDPGKFRTKPLSNSGKRAGRAGPHKNPIDPLEFTGDLGACLRGVGILVGYVCVLIEPDCVRIQL